VNSASGISVGSYLVITQLNDGVIVNQNGSEGQCTWCDVDKPLMAVGHKGRFRKSRQFPELQLALTPVVRSLHENADCGLFQCGGATITQAGDLQIYANGTHTSNQSNIEI